jgi:CRP-like cAMP-binding protein
MFETLRNLRFLREIPEEDLQQIASIATLAAYPANGLLFREGSILNRIFIVVEGNVALELKAAGQEPRRIHTVGEGELLGWSPILNEQAMTATARALTPTKAVSLFAAQVLALCHHNPRFGFLFMQRLAEALAARLNATRLQLLDVYKDELPTIADEPGAGD